MQVLKTSEMIAEMKPVWTEFILELGYTRKRAAAFAEGYAAEVAKLPLFGKMSALSRQDDRCMTAGFKAAGIDEEEALRRSRMPARKRKVMPARPTSKARAKKLRV